MRILKANLLVSIIVLLTFIVVGLAQKNTNSSIGQPRLAVEIGLSTPMTVNAGTEERGLKAFWRIPSNANGDSAIKLEPKMAGNKVKVTVTVLSGDTSVVKSCNDWGLLKESRVTTYLLNEGEEVTVSQLSDLGSNFKGGKLTFRAVPAIATLQDQEAEPCCAHCDGNSCCPAKNACLNCGSCGQLCC